jgi:Flp pilus assembly protein TadG
MKSLKRLRSLLRSEGGNVMAVTAALMPLIVGAAAIGVDSINLTLAKRQLQRSADSAALAGAYALVQSMSATTAVDRDLALNNKLTLSTTRTVETPTTWGTPVKTDSRAVRVALTMNRSTPFWSVFSHSTTPVSVEAKAAYVYLGEFCMVSLTSDTSTGVTFTGNTTMNLGCGVESNSKGSAAISASGSCSVTASPIAGVGGVPSNAACYASGTKLLPYSPPLADPFAYLPRTPTPPSDCVSIDLSPNGNSSINWKTLGASRSYCVVGSNNGQNAAKIQSNVTFPSNVTVYIQGGTLDIGPATVSGTNVSFVLTTPPGSTTGVASMTMNANAVLNLTAQTTGTYAGVLFYQDPRVTSGSTTTINGNSGATLTGAFYFPNGDLQFNGTAGMTITCLQLVALHLTFSGNSTITNSCKSTDPGTGPKSFAGYFVKLVA